MDNHSNRLDHHLIGWFAVALSKELIIGKTVNGLLAGNHYTLSRTATGLAMLNGATINVMEKNNIIFVWNHPHHKAPHWNIPPLDDIGWSSYLYHKLDINSHPQEVYENSIDVAHFAVVHGFDALSVIQPPHFDKHTMSVRHTIRRKQIRLFSQQLVEASFEVFLHGLGCAHTHIFVPSLDLTVRMLTLATPMQAGKVEIRLAVAILTAKMKPLKRMVMPLMHRLIQKNIINDFSQDIIIWENKCYWSSPLLVSGDGQILKFRSWCQQFYAYGDC
jgi:hypothetical protein